ncbi:MAG: ABC transporter ATP-binding protein [Nocardioidaceae bacterium]|nr:ABC transporter ATP-binding protein [Nocardioidaceae bacterium]
MSAHLTLRGLSRCYGSPARPALSDLTLAVPAGSCLAVVGPSGSGKTTVLRLASGLDRPDAGDVLINGTSVLDVAPEDRGMAMVFQRPLLFPHRNVLDNVAFSARVRGASRRRARIEAAEYLNLVHLSGFGSRHSAELSGGQEQRVALARALAARPKVLLLDEPFSALDAALRSEMQDLVRQVRAALDPTIVLVTHDQNEAASLADCVAVLSSGRLVQHDPVERIYSRPTSLVAARQMGGRNEVPGEVRGHHHHSVLGSLALPVDVRPSQGPGVLVFRQESVQVSDPDDLGAEIQGLVKAVRPTGPRSLLTIEVADGGGPKAVQQTVEIHAETPPGHHAEVGERVGVRLAPHALAVVSPAPEHDLRSVQMTAASNPPVHALRRRALATDRVNQRR